MTTLHIPDHVHLLGPQRLHPTLRPALDRAQIGDRIATITGGWEEREGEDEELRSHVARDVVDLRIWGRLEGVFAADSELRAAMQERYDRIRVLRRLYQRQLAHALASARELLTTHDGWCEDLYELATEASIDAVRIIDRKHREHVADIHTAFRERLDPSRHPELERQRDEIRATLETCSALCIAGGHVAILLNRMRALGVLDHWGARPIFAWSAGAMVLCDDIVLFHDRPPQGAGDAELLEPGFGLVKDIVVLPHAKRRLRLDDPMRVALFARRFAPARAIALDDGACLEARQNVLTHVDGSSRLEEDGSVVLLQTSGSAA
ncbi:MAG: Type 1 glutamine amidotransferase-like domain-containing protein [Planctomycetes bacterium]|nr:Type 1 glutamine amidotransferase-like domain-containing protein [Planctomycetota bacterium]